MGNPQSQPPKNYNNDEVHEGEYLQTYHPNPSADQLNMGTGNPSMSLGAKIIRSTRATKDRHGNIQPAGEYYVVSKTGGKVFLSQNGQFLDSATQLVKNAKNYGAGPAIIIGGTPGKPNYTLFASTSTSPGNDYSATTVNNLGDLRRVIKYGHEHDPPGKYSNRYGNAAVNPFTKRPRNGFSTLADIGRGIETAVDMFAVPVFEEGLNALTDGFLGTALSVTGLDNFLQDGLDSLLETKEGIDFQSSQGSTDLSMSSWISDPRLDDELQAIEANSRSRVDKFPKNQYSPQLAKILNSRQGSNMDKVTRLRKLQGLNLSLDADQQMQVLRKTVKIMKQKAPNVPDFDWGTVERGMELATNPSDMLRLAQITTRNLKNKVLPVIRKQQQSAASQHKSETVVSKSETNPVTNPTSQDKSTTINGARAEHASLDTIHPFIPAPVPIM